MKHLIKYLILLAIGGTVYCGIEILVRGFTHWTMFLVGGICFILIGIINEITPKMPLVRQMLLSAVIITVVEDRYPRRFYPEVFVSNNNRLKSVELN